MNYLNLILDKHQSQAVVPNLASLIWAASALDFMGQWFMGRGIWRLEMRKLKHDAATYFFMQPMDLKDNINKPLRVSSVGQIGSFIERKDFPAKLVEPWTEHEIGNEGTLVNFVGIAPKVSIGLLTYGLSDLAMDLFKRGATNIKCQYSQEQSQVFGNIGMGERDLHEFTDLNHPDYEAHESVGDLP